MSDSVKTVIIGGGQAGLSLSYYLTQLGQENLVLEKADRAGDAWRNQRWDSFTLVTPNWSFRLPGGEYQGDDPNGYMKRDEIVRCFEDYAERYHLPVAYGNEVTRVDPEDQAGYCVRTLEKEYHARNVVIANGYFQVGKLPDFAAKIPGPIVQMHSSSYRNPRALPDGAIVVVGSAQSGMQIAEELYQSGRKVFLATSGASRAPRRYRGKDIFEWLYLWGYFEHSLDTFPFISGRKFAPPSVTGKDGGHTLNLHQFFRDGVTLLGHVQQFEEGKLILSPDLKENLAKSDKTEKMILKNLDEFIQKSGIDAPQEEIPELMDGYAGPDVSAVDLQREKIGSIIWASGYQYTSSIIPLPVLGEGGYPVTKRWETNYPGLYFLGIPFIPKLKSGFLFGVAEDAAQLAEQLAQKG